MPTTTRQDEVDLRIERARHGFSHRLRSAHSWVVSAGSFRQLLGELKIPERLLIQASLGGRPVQCADIRKSGRAARLEDELLVVDNSLATSFGCPATQLGAQLTIEMLDRVMGEPRCGMAAVSVSRDARAVCRGIWDSIEGLPKPSEEDLLRLAVRLDDFDERFRQSNDVAQTVAFYLACHPNVAQVSYPGLPRDASFEVASRTLRHGFGPVVDFRMEGVGLEDAVRMADIAREGFLDLDAADEHETGLAPLGPLGSTTGSLWFRLHLGPTDPKEVVDVLETVLCQ